MADRMETIDAPADAVWETITDGDWLGDGGALEPWPGGAVAAQEDGHEWVGVVTDVEVGRRIAFTWFATPGDQIADVELELVPEGEVTRLVISERPVAVPAPARFAGTADALARA